MERQWAFLGLTSNVPQVPGAGVLLSFVRWCFRPPGILGIQRAEAPALGQPQLCLQGVPVPVGRQTLKPVNVVIRIRVWATGREDAQGGGASAFLVRVRVRGLRRGGVAAESGKMGTVAWVLCWRED